MLSSYISRIDDVKMKHFCHIDIINYILSDFSAKCKHNHVSFEYTIEIEDIKTDMNLFAPILSNALDNALNAQKELIKSQRHVKILTCRNIFFLSSCQTVGFNYYFITLSLIQFSS